MPSAGEWERFVRRMGEDPSTCCLGSVFLLSFFFLTVGLCGYASDSSNKAFLYLILTATSLWLLLFCCGWTVRPALNPFSDLPTCVWCSVVLVIVLGVVTGTIFLLASAYNADNEVNFAVADATLTRFSLSDEKSTLRYDLRVDVVVGPNTKKHGVYYETLHAWASYQGLLFGSLSLPPFYLAHNSSAGLLRPLVFHGQRDQLALSPDGLKRYRKDEATGRFSIAVTLSYLGSRTTGHHDNDTAAMVKDRHQLKGVVTFDLKVHLLVNESGGASSTL